MDFFKDSKNFFHFQEPQLKKKSIAAVMKPSGFARSPFKAKLENYLHNY